MALGRNKVPHPWLTGRQSKPHLIVKIAVTTASLQKNHTMGPTSEHSSALLSLFHLSIKRLLSKRFYRHHLSYLLTSSHITAQQGSLCESQSALHLPASAASGSRAGKGCSVPSTRLQEERGSHRMCFPLNEPKENDSGGSVPCLPVT